MDKISNNEAAGEAESKIAKDAADYWTESLTSEDKRGVSHWRNSPQWKNEEQWLNIGRENFTRYEEFARQINFRRPIKKMLEWGPGGGSNALAFANEVETFYGVDISKPNLYECRHQLELAGAKDKFIPIHIDPEKPEGISSVIPMEDLDLFLCTSVLQHMPSKKYVVNMLAIVYHLLKPGGIAIVQARYDDGSEKTAQKNSDYHKNVLFFTSFHVHEFWDILQNVIGFKPKQVSLELPTNYAYYFFQK